MARIRRWLLVLICAALVSPVPAEAGEDWKNEEGYQRLLRAEAKTLKPLLEEALKSDFRRQAWYLAGRVLEANPDDRVAVETLEKWTTEELQLGAPLKKAFRSRLVNALRKLGDDYFHFGETLEAAGVDPVDYYAINVRAQSYGSEAGPLIASMQQGGYMWLGTYGHEEEKAVRTILGDDLFEQVTYPPEWDDEYLKLKVGWPDCRVMQLDGWRLVTDHAYADALRALRRIVHVEGWMKKHLGKGKASDEPTTVVLFKKRSAYLTIGQQLVRQRYRDPLMADTGFWVDRYQRAFVSDADAENPWIGESATLQGMVARALAKTRYSKGAGGRVTGRGEWLLQGMRGLGEALHYTDAEQGIMELDPKRSWRLAVTRALQDSDALIPWGQLFDHSEAMRLKAERTASLEFSMGGVKREAKHVDVVSAQAATFVLAVALSDKKKGPKALAKLVSELFKRDSLGDPWKLLKWTPKQLILELNKALDEVEVAK